MRSIFDPDELAVPGNPDVSCVVALHLFAREGQLHMVCCPTRETSSVSRHSFPPLPRETTFRTIAAVLEHEEALRTNHVQYRPEDVAGLGLPEYWQQVVLLFEVHRQITHRPGGPVDQAVHDALGPGLRWLMARRWPERMPIASGAVR